MKTELDMLFYIGVLVPTTITIGFFVGFLLCWFRCDLKEKLIAIHNKRLSKPAPSKSAAKEAVDANEHIDKASQHSADSAIDVNELEMAAADDSRPNARGSAGEMAVAYSSTFSADELQPQAVSISATHTLTEAEVHTSLSKGIYPSREKLNDEINSEPRIYESLEDIEVAMYNGLAAVSHAPAHPAPPTTSRSYLYSSKNRPVERVCHPYNSTTRLSAIRRTSYGGSIGTPSIEDNHLTDYGFAPWQRPYTVCGLGTAPPLSTQFQTKYSLPKYAPSNLTWNKEFLESSANSFSGKILHV